MKIALALFFLLIGIFFMIINSIILLKKYYKKPCPSVNPFVGGILVSLGILLILEQNEHKWLIGCIPLFIDYGCAPTVFRCIFLFVKELRESKR